MIHTRSVEPEKTPVPTAAAATPSDAEIVEAIARTLDRIGFAGGSFDPQFVFLKGDGDFTKAELTKHADAAVDRAIEIKRAREAARRVA